MDFSFSEEQQMLRESARRFIYERYDFEHRKQVRASRDGWSRELWLQLGELGLLAINIPEEDGGIGAGPVGTMLVSNVVGEGLLLEPFLSSAVVATRAIVQIGSSEQRQRWLPSMASGELVAVLAHDESGSRLDTMAVETTAVAHADGWRISGAKSLVYHAPAANLLLVSASVDSELGLFAVPADAAGVTLSSYTTVDDQRAADVALNGVHVPRAARLGGEIRDSLQAVLDYGLAALCAEAFGCMERIFGATTSYSRSRIQFGVPIASFQALQHRMADMLMHLEQSRSMSYLATSRCAGSDSQARSVALSAAKALMGQAARYLGQQAVQLHGGMGMTDELDVSHCFRRLLAFELRYGTTDQHLERYRRDMS
jgi:alkylation response protein AidB-like acyl-CoA dehydrogenase